MILYSILFMIDDISYCPTIVVGPFLHLQVPSFGIECFVPDAQAVRTIFSYEFVLILKILSESGPSVKLFKERVTSSPNPPQSRGFTQRSYIGGATLVFHRQNFLCPY